jgi:hypothetical protein
MLITTENFNNTERKADRVYGVITAENTLLYDTLRPNPNAVLRAVKKSGIDATGCFLAEFSMKRRRDPGDFRGFSLQKLRGFEPYVGPMR